MTTSVNDTERANSPFRVGPQWLAKHDGAVTAWLEGSYDDSVAPWRQGVSIHSGSTLQLCEERPPFRG